MQSALPKWLRTTWLLLAPLGLLFVARIAYETTVMTWHYGPQMIGFSMMHVHRTFFISGALCCYGFMLWPFVAAYFMVRRHKHISKPDIAMNVLCLLVIIITIVPDNFFA